jgi:hypothetical protein
MKCCNFRLRRTSSTVYIGSRLLENLAVDEPSFGNNRYFGCILDRDAPIHLESSLLKKDTKARWKFERREVNERCAMLVEQQIRAWSNEEEN